MIAKNYVRYPEALRFQVEMFSRSYKNSPRIMRLMECIFSFAPSVPSWVREAQLRAKALVKKWKQVQDVLPFFSCDPGARKTYPGAPVLYRGPNGETWSGRGLMPRWIAHMIKHLGYTKEAFLVQ